LLNLKIEPILLQLKWSYSWIFYMLS